MKERIEKIAQDVCGNCSRGVCILDGKKCDLKCTSREVAEKIYNAGYSKQEWISVDERLPETRETILYFNGEWVDACYFDGDNFMTLDTYESSIVDNVTHWMPLPEPPKMKGGAE